MVFRCSAAIAGDIIGSRLEGHLRRQRVHVTDDAPLYDDALSPDWHYRKDPTRAVFYREKIMRHLAASRGWSCDVLLKDVALMQRPVGKAVRHDQLAA
jgi:hypothetical protein